MVLTLELPIHRPRLNWAENYENRFGALPDWLDDLASGEAAALLRQAGVEGIQGRPQEALPVGAPAGESPGRGGVGRGSMDVHRQHPLGPPTGAAEGGVIGEAQVVAEPVDQGGHGVGAIKVVGGGASRWRRRAADCPGIP